VSVKAYLDRLRVQRLDAVGPVRLYDLSRSVIELLEVRSSLSTNVKASENIVLTLVDILFDTVPGEIWGIAIALSYAINNPKEVDFSDRRMARVRVLHVMEEPRGPNVPLDQVPSTWARF
jgi:hypothetical protein